MSTLTAGVVGRSRGSSCLSRQIGSTASVVDEIAVVAAVTVGKIAVAAAGGLKSLKEGRLIRLHFLF